MQSLDTEKIKNISEIFMPISSIIRQMLARGSGMENINAYINKEIEFASSYLSKLLPDVSRTRITKVIQEAVKVEAESSDFNFCTAIYKACEQINHYILFDQSFEKDVAMMAKKITQAYKENGLNVVFLDILKEVLKNPILAPCRDDINAVVRENSNPRSSFVGHIFAIINDIHIDDIHDMEQRLKNVLDMPGGEEFFEGGVKNFLGVAARNQFHALTNTQSLKLK